MIRRFRLWIAAVLLLSALPASAGGPPIVTLSTIPEFFQVGKKETLKFAVRAWCCGNAPLAGFDTYTVLARADGQRDIRIPAVPVGENGEYEAALTLTAPGPWNLTVDFSYGVLSPRFQRQAVRPGSPVPAPLSLSALGARAFIEKGCGSCHIHGEIAVHKTNWVLGRMADEGEWESHLVRLGYPDLTGRAIPDEVLRRILANPWDVHDGSRMPNLRLSNEDVAALTEFINGQNPER